MMPSSVHLRHDFARIFRLDPHSGELMEEWQVDGAEVHGLTRSADGRIWIGDAATNQILVVER